MCFTINKFFKEVSYVASNLLMLFRIGSSVAWDWIEKCAKFYDEIHQDTLQHFSLHPTIPGRASISLSKSLVEYYQRIPGNVASSSQFSAALACMGRQRYLTDFSVVLERDKDGKITNVLLVIQA